MPHPSSSGVLIFNDRGHEYYDFIGGRKVLRLYSTGAVPRYLEKAIREERLHTVPQALITENNLNRVRGEFHGNGFELAVAYGQLNRLPSLLLTARHLLSPNDHGVTCMLTAAHCGCLYQIPRHFLTPENIHHADDDGFSVAHAAAYRTGGLRCIPRRFLTDEIVHMDSWHGYTPLHLAAYSGTLRELPASFWTLDHLFRPDAFGQDAFWHAAIGGNLQGIPILGGFSSHYAAIRVQVTRALNESYLERKAEKRKKARDWMVRLARLHLTKRDGHDARPNPSVLR